MPASIKSQKSKEINSIFFIDNEFYPMKKESQRKLTHLLEQQYQCLLNKKQKEKLKKQRIQKLENMLEMQRQSRINKINQKISHSTMVRDQSIKEKMQKTRKKFQNYQKVKTKIAHANEQELDKHYEMRKQYSLRKSQSRSSVKKLSESKLNQSLSAHRNLSSTPLNQIDIKIQKIEEKIDRAKTNNHFYKQQIVDKMKCSIKNGEDIKQKIKVKSIMQETKCFGSYYERISHINSCKERAKSLCEKEIEKKKSNFYAKIKKCTQNLKFLDQERQNKYQKLQHKFNRSISPKAWKSQKNEAYLQLFIKNHIELEQKKVKMAQEIIQKHLDITLKNKAYKEKKDKMIQIVKKSQT